MGLAGYGQGAGLAAQNFLAAFKAVRGMADEDKRNEILDLELAERKRDIANRRGLANYMAEKTPQSSVLTAEESPYEPSGASTSSGLSLMNGDGGQTGPRAPSGFRGYLNSIESTQEPQPMVLDVPTAANTTGQVGETAPSGRMAAMADKLSVLKGISFPTGRLKENPRPDITRAESPDALDQAAKYYASRGMMKEALEARRAQREADKEKLSALSTVGTFVHHMGEAGADLNTLKGPLSEFLKGAGVDASVMDVTYSRKTGFVEAQMSDGTRYLTDGKTIHFEPQRAEKQAKTVNLEVDQNGRHTPGVQHEWAIDSAGNRTKYLGPGKTAGELISGSKEDRKDARDAAKQAEASRKDYNRKYYGALTKYQKEKADDINVATGNWNETMDALRSEYPDLYENAKGGALPETTPGTSGIKNNPFNVKLGGSTKYLVDQGHATVGRAATDGGNFLDFKDEASGIRAAKQLLQTDYKSLTVDAAMKRWSNNGYGGEIAPFLKGKTVSQLSGPELDTLMGAMRKAEGNGTSGSRQATASTSGLLKGDRRTVPGLDAQVEWDGSKWVAAAVTPHPGAGASSPATPPTRTLNQLRGEASTLRADYDEATRMNHPSVNRIKAKLERINAELAPLEAENNRHFLATQQRTKEQKYQEARNRGSSGARALDLAAQARKRRLDKYMEQ